MTRNRLRFLKYRSVASHLRPEEYEAVAVAARKSRQTISTWVRSVLIDALCEEGHDFSKCSRSAGGTPVGESFETSRGSAS